MAAAALSAVTSSSLTKSNRCDDGGENKQNYLEPGPSIITPTGGTQDGIIFASLAGGCTDGLVIL